MCECFWPETQKQKQKKSPMIRSSSGAREQKHIKHIKIEANAVGGIFFRGEQQQHKKGKKKIIFKWKNERENTMRVVSLRLLHFHFIATQLDVPIITEDSQERKKKKFLFIIFLFFLATLLLVKCDPSKNHKMSIAMSGGRYRQTESSLLHFNEWENLSHQDF